MNLQAAIERLHADLERPHRRGEVSVSPADLRLVLDNCDELRALQERLFKLAESERARRIRELEASLVRVQALLDSCDIKIDGRPTANVPVAAVRAALDGATA